MSAELYSAILNPAGPNYGEWREILGTEKVPLKSAASVNAELGPERNVEVYFLNLPALTLPQRAALLARLAKKFNAPIYEVEKEIDSKGFPIRAADLIVSFSTRAFV
jgi:hypothetical protein